MTKDRDNRSYMDYEELRRRHELYKNRTRKAAPQNPDSRDAETQPSRSVPRVKPETEAEPVVPIAEEEAASVELEPAADDPIEEESPAVEESVAEEPDEDIEDEDTADEDEEEADTNPFSQFISLYQNAKKLFSGRRASKKEKAGYEDDFADEEPVESTAASEDDIFSEEGEDMPAEQPAEEQPVDVFVEEDTAEESSSAEEADELDDEELFDEEEEKVPFFARLKERAGSLFRRKSDEEMLDEDEDLDEDEEADADEDLIEEGVSAEDDIFEDAPADDAESERSPYARPEEEEILPESVDPIEPTDDIPSLFDDEGDTAESVDEDELYDAEEDEPRAASGFSRFLGLFIQPVDDEEETLDDADDDESDEYSYSENGAYDAEDEDYEGGLSMDEQKKYSANLTEELAQGLGERTLTRRERRELAERQAAEAAAAEAAAAAEKAQVEEPAVQPEEKEEPAAIDFGAAPVIDEPTREFKPVQRSAQTATPAPAATPSLYDVDDDEDDYDDDEDEEPVSRREAKRAAKAAKAAEKKAKAEAKKAKRRKDEDEDEYDEDDYDDYDEYDDDEDDEEEDRRSSRRSKRSRRVKDDYDDEDDYDEDDEDYDDDYDDDDDYDHPIRRGFFGFLKWIFGIAVVLVVLVIVLNLLAANGKGPLFSDAYGTVRGWAPEFFDKVFPYAQVEQIDDVTAPEETPVPELEATPAPVVTEPTDAVEPETNVPTDATETGAVTEG